MVGVEKRADTWLRLHRSYRQVEIFRREKLFMRALRGGFTAMPLG